MGEEEHCLLKQEDRCIFCSNVNHNVRASNAKNGNGGAVVIRHIAFLAVTGSVYINNMATGDGGGLYVEGAFTTPSTFNMISNKFSSNQAKTGNGGAIAVVDVRQLAVNANEFYHNFASYHGGALYI